MTKIPRPQTPFDLHGQVVLVTGARRGIGEACAIALATAGADVALGLRDRKSGSRLVKRIERLGRRALPLQMDVTRLDEIESAVDAVVQQFGRIDVLVNNVGISLPAPAVEATEASFDATVAVNLKGTFFCSQAVGRIMVHQRRGRIINLGSQAGTIALADESIYCMTKAAISHLTKCLAVEWAPHGINVNAVAPTFIKTPGSVQWLKDPAFKASVIRRIPLGRLGELEDVASPVVFLASPAASLITGTTLLIDGGWTLT